MKSIRQLSLMFLVSLFSITTLGNSIIKEEMKVISEKFQVIGRQINTPAQNPSSILLLQELEVAILRTQTQSPTSLDPLSPEERRAGQIKFQRMMSKLYNLALDAEEALTAGRNPEALQLLLKMDAVRKEGHAAFKP